MPKYAEVQMVAEDRNGSPVVLPTVIDTEQVRNFHPRKFGQTGTRLVFKNGAGMPVINSYPDVARLFGLEVTWTVPAEANVLDEEDEDNVVNMADR